MGLFQYPSPSPPGKYLQDLDVHVLACSRMSLIRLGRRQCSTAGRKFVSSQYFGYFAALVVPTT